MYKKGGKTNSSKRKAPALSPTGRLLDDPRPQEKEKDIPYFLSKDYVKGGRKSAIAADAPSPYEKARDRRSNNYDRLAEAATINANEAFYEGEMSKEEHGKAKKAIQKFKENKDNAMRESGHGRTPEEKKAQDRAIRRMKNRKAKGGMKVKKYAKGGPIVPDNKGETAEDQAMAIVKQKGAERRAALQPFYDLESEVNAARKTYDEHVERLKVLSKHGPSYKRMLQTLRKDREAIANLLKDDRMNIEGVSGVEKSNLRRMMPK